MDDGRGKALSPACMKGDSMHLCHFLEHFWNCIGTFYMVIQNWNYVWTATPIAVTSYHGIIKIVTCIDFTRHWTKLEAKRVHKRYNIQGSSQDDLSGG